MAEQQFITFFLGDDLYGVDILVVREVYPSPDLTFVDAAPDCVKGLLNLRGQIVTVLDLAKRLRIDHKPTATNISCIVLKSKLQPTQDRDTSNNNDIVGLLVDKIGDVITVAPETIEPPPPHTHKDVTPFIAGVVKTEKNLMVILQANALIQIE